MLIIIAIIIFIIIIYVTNNIENYENENEEEYENNKYKSNYELNNEYDDLVKISQEEKQCDNKFLDTNQILETKNLRKKKMIIY